MITNEMIITFPCLFEAKENLSGALKYSGSFMISKDDKAGIAKIQAEISKAHAAGVTKGFWKAQTKISSFKNLPLRDGDAELEDGQKEGSEYKNVLFFNASSNEKSKPGVVGPDTAPLTDEDAIYSGCIVRADVKAFPYKAGGNTGIGWWLNNVMLVRDGDRLDGKMNAIDAFSSYASTEDADTSGADDLA